MTGGFAFTQHQSLSETGASTFTEALPLSNLVLERPASARPATEYAELKRIIREHGLFKSQPAYYVMKSVVTASLLAVAIGVVLFVSNPIVLLLDAAFFGFVSTQVGLLAHDVGHRQGFRGRRMNAIARYFFGNVLLGVSQSWWNVKHNQHHATPNHVDDDPDIQFPMIVFSPDQIANRPRWLHPAIAIQAFVFPLLLPFQALNMRMSSAQHLFAPDARKRFLQALLLATHVALYAALLIWIGNWPIAVGFFLIHQMTFGLYNSSVFASNHKGMPLTDEGRRMGFLYEQVLTSRNVRANPLTDFWYGGLNYQIEHHLFPSLPRNRLRQAQKLVRQFCDDHGISYHSTGLIESYAEILQHLHQVSAPLRQRKTATA